MKTETSVPPGEVKIETSVPPGEVKMETNVPPGEEECNLDGTGALVESHTHFPIVQHEVSGDNKQTQNIAYYIGRLITQE